jgi:Universal stress protein family
MRQWKRIVVGVDGSPASRAALEWAGDEAVRHGSELVVLTAWLPVPPPLAGTSSTLPTHGVTDASETAKEQLMAAIRDVLGEDPPVLVQPQVKEGSETAHRPLRGRRSSRGRRSRPRRIRRDAIGIGKPPRRGSCQVHGRRGPLTEPSPSLAPPVA